MVCNVMESCISSRYVCFVRICNAEHRTCFFRMVCNVAVIFRFVLQCPMTVGTRLVLRHLWSAAINIQVKFRNHGDFSDEIYRKLSGVWIGN